MHGFNSELKCSNLNLKLLMLLIFASVRLVCIDSKQNWPWFGTDVPSTRRVIEAQNISLKCGGRLEDVSARWDFKNCSNRFDKSCSDNEHEHFKARWRTLPYDTSVISIQNVRRADEGFYRCRQVATDLLYIYYTTYLEVVPLPDANDALPQFLNGSPENITVYKKSQAVFQCKVLSNTITQIIWVYQGSAPGAFRHMDEWYAPLSGSTSVYAGSVRLSKLIVPKVTSEHSGRYFCIAINTKGYSYSDAYLQVLDDEEYKLHDEYFNLLFLLPIGLAMIPICMWTCFVCYKKWRNKLDTAIFQSLQIQHIEDAN